MKTAARRETSISQLAQMNSAMSAEELRRDNEAAMVAAQQQAARMQAVGAIAYFANLLTIGAT